MYTLFSLQCQGVYTQNLEIGVWDEKQAIVFDIQFKLLRQELWGEQTEQIENELIQEMENAKKAIKKLKMKAALQYLHHIMLILTHAMFILKEELPE